MRHSTLPGSLELGAFVGSGRNLSPERDVQCAIELCKPLHDSLHDRLHWMGETAVPAPLGFLDALVGGHIRRHRRFEQGQVDAFAPDAQAILAVVQHCCAAAFF